MTGDMLAPQTEELPGKAMLEPLMRSGRSSLRCMGMRLRN